MTVQISLGQITSTTFKSSLEQLNAAPVPATTAYRLKTITQKINEALQAHDAVRKELLTRYCIKSETGEPLVAENGTVSFSPEDLPKVEKELNDLMAVSVDLEPIKVSALGNISLKAETLFALGDLICE